MQLPQGEASDELALGTVCRHCVGGVAEEALACCGCLPTAQGAAQFPLLSL
jgi:hypothetical protein